jgi:hypothetical protein
MRLDVSKGHSRVHGSIPSPEDGNIQFLEHFVFWFLEYSMMDKVQEPKDSEWVFHAPVMLLYILQKNTYMKVSHF